MAANDSNKVHDAGCWLFGGENRQGAIQLSRSQRDVFVKLWFRMENDT